MRPARQTERTAGVPAGTGERVSVSMSRTAISGNAATEGHTAVEEYTGVEGRTAAAGRTVNGGYEVVPGPQLERPEAAMFRRRSLQPSRRAVLHVQAAGDPAIPSDLADWFTQRAFHFYLAGLRVPHRLTARPGARSLAAACADLDAACSRLRQADGISSVIVAAQGRGALAAALWMGGRSSEDRQAGDCHADALVLCEPELPARPIKLSIGCPVLVVTGPPLNRGGSTAGEAISRWSLRQHRGAPAAAQLGSHVTWLHLPPADWRTGQAEGAGRQLFFDELGRWLGAYMYGPVRDQLL